MATDKKQETPKPEPAPAPPPALFLPGLPCESTIDKDDVDPNGKCNAAQAAQFGVPEGTPFTAFIKATWEDGRKLNGIGVQRWLPWFSADATRSWDAFIAELPRVVAAWKKLDEEGVSQFSVLGQNNERKVSWKTCGAKGAATPALLVDAIARGFRIFQNTGMHDGVTPGTGLDQFLAPATKEKKARGTKERKVSTGGVNI